MACKSSLKKEHQTKYPIQIPYHIKVSLQEYYNKFDTWQPPDFSEKCPICGGVECATFLGYYVRAAICPQTGFYVSDLPILRYLCHDKGDARVCDHVTFSLLPHKLVPFRRLPLNFMVEALWIKISRCLSFTKAVDAIEEELNHLSDVADCISISAIMSWQHMILSALAQFISSDIDMIPNSHYKQIQGSSDLKLFIEILIKHHSQNCNHPIRGPDAFAWNFYKQSGGSDQNAAFLFGCASQHKK